jgi:hypothetical protein
MSDKFEEAYRRARRKVGEAAWRLLTSAEQEAAVAAELRAMADEQRDNGNQPNGCECQS